MSRVLLQLGRFGDLINVLPLAAEAKRLEKPVTICTNAQFASLFDGISYAQGAGVTFPIEQVGAARTWLRERGHEVFVSQVYGVGADESRQTESFMRDSWARVGSEPRWEQLSLFFDRRNATREAELAAKVSWERPVVLYSLAGVSAPFRGAEKLVAQLTERLPEFTLIDLNVFRVDRLYDLLGLMDRASALITVDTATLHLAKASSVPVVALVHDRPWYGSLRSANHLITRTYREVDPEEIAEAVRRTVLTANKFVHVWQDWDMSPDDRARNTAAAASWPKDRRWESVGLDGFEDTSAKLGDERPVPYINDVMEAGFDRTKRRHDIVVFTNSDISMSDGIVRELERTVLAKGCAFAYRFNTSGAGFGSRPGITSGYWDGGLDLFAFSRAWYERHGRRLPPMFIGRPHWDLVYRDIFKMTGGGDLTGCIWHKAHASFWTQNPTNAGNVHNTTTARDFFSRHDTTRPYRWEC